MKKLRARDLITSLKTAISVNNWGDRKIVTPCDEEQNDYSTLWSTSLEIGDYFGDQVLYLGWEYNKDKNSIPKPVTVRELLDAVEKFLNTHHTYDHNIIVPSDDEQNGECALWCGLSEINDDDYEDYQFHDFHTFDEYKKEWVILW